MSKGLDALEKVEDFYIDYGGYDETGEYKNYISLYQTLEYQVIKKELERLGELEKAFDTLSKEDEKTKKLLSKEIEKNRAFEIMIEKDITPSWFIRNLKKGMTYEDYHFSNNGGQSDMTREQFDTLVGVLL